MHDAISIIIFSIEVMKLVCVSVSGINFAKQFVVRELSLYFPQSGGRMHYFLEPPRGLKLDDADKKTDVYTKRVLGGISIYERIPGSIAYSELENILAKLVFNHRMLCIGHVTLRFLEELLPYAAIQDIQLSTALKYPKTLPRLDCGYRHEGRHCSLAKLRYFKDNYNF